VIRHSERRPLALLVAAYLVLAVLYSAVLPLFESPDEVWHYAYIRWLAAGKGLAAPEDVDMPRPLHKRAASRRSIISSARPSQRSFPPTTPTR
jgi:hypothetical protein